MGSVEVAQLKLVTTVMPVPALVLAVVIEEVFVVVAQQRTPL